MGFITVMLFFVAFFAFFSKQKHFTLIIIAVLASQYFRLADPNFFIGPFSFQHSDFALLLIFSLLPFRNKLNDIQLKGIIRGLLVFILFLAISITYDLLIRGTTPMQIFRTTRKLGYLAFFFLMASFSLRDYQRFIKFIIAITIIHALLYIAQYIFSFSLVPDNVRYPKGSGLHY